MQDIFCCWMPHIRNLIPLSLFYFEPCWAEGLAASLRKSVLWLGLGHHHCLLGPAPFSLCRLEHENSASAAKNIKKHWARTLGSHMHVAENSWASVKNLPHPRRHPFVNGLAFVLVLPATQVGFWSQPLQMLSLLLESSGGRLGNADITAQKKHNPKQSKFVCLETVFLPRKKRTLGQDSFGVAGTPTAAAIVVVAVALIGIFKAVLRSDLVPWQKIGRLLVRLPGIQGEHEKVSSPAWSEQFLAPRLGH